MKNCWIPVVLALMLTLVAGAPQDQSLLSARIAGGSLAADGEFPYIVSIQISSKHICTGFIYNDKWILSTASCVYGRLASQLVALVGVTTFTTSTLEQQTIPVASIVPFTGYDNTTQLHDIALISLARPIVFGSLVKSIFYDEVNEANPTAVVAGWGATTNGGIEVTRLRKATLTITPTCPDYSLMDYDYAYMVCAGSATSSPCQYDEGSPLVQNGFAVGIMSKNKGCGTPYVPSIFTRISTYYYWIGVTAGQQIGGPTTPASESTTTTETTTTTLSSTTTSPTTLSTTTTSPTTTKLMIPTAPCINCETPPTPTTVKPIIPTAPCVNCETTSTTIAAKPPVPTAPCVGCNDEVPFLFRHLKNHL